MGNGGNHNLHVAIDRNPLGNLPDLVVVHRQRNYGGEHVQALGEVLDEIVIHVDFEDLLGVGDGPLDKR